MPAETRRVQEKSSVVFNWNSSELTQTDIDIISGKWKQLFQNKIKDYNINIPVNETAEPINEIFHG